MVTPAPKAISLHHENSRNANSTPKIVFKAPTKHDFPIAVFRCTHAIGTIMLAKHWLFSNYDNLVYQTPGVLRMESQEMDQVNPGEEGTLLLLEHAAWMECSAGEIDVRILALLMPGDSRVRFWYSTVASFNGLLQDLNRHGWIALKKLIEPHTKSGHRVMGKNGQLDPDSHCRVFVWLREEFLKALSIPEHPDYITAISITDYAPEIPNPDAAMQRIEATYQLYDSNKQHGDISNDRYLLHLHPAEREIASCVQLSCAEYLFVKRTFFRDWYFDVMRTDKKVENGEKVRTNNAHEQYISKELQWSDRRSRKLVVAWRALGILEEVLFTAWIKQGGMLAESMKKASAREDHQSRPSGSA